MNQVPVETIHVALSFDENYINQFYAVVASIFVNNSRRIKIHAIISGISETLKTEICNYVSSNDSSINFYSVPANFGAGFRLDGNWTVAAYYRLLFPELLSDDIKKYIYIDTDTLVIGDLWHLWSVSLGTCVVAAVRDRLIVTRPDLDINQPYTYFNSGVLLINRNLWEQQNITKRSIDFLNTYPEKVLYADQDALNYLLQHKWKSLDIRFNLMFADIPETLPNSQFDAFLSDKIILHFTQHRPWKLLCENRFRYLYHHYLKHTPAAASAGHTLEPWTFANVKKLLRIRLRELYFDNPTVSQGWRALKQRLLHKAV